MAVTMNNTKLKQLILKVLKADERLWNEDKTELNQILLLDLVEKIDEKVIDLLLQEKDLREKFFVKIKDVYVFKTNNFRFFMEENKVDNSYTAYKNRIGLTDGKKFLKDTNDVVLDFPYKDCVLEGGQSTEEGTDTYFEYEEEKTKTVKGEKVTEVAGYKEKQGKRKEIFFNSVLAHDEIDRLFDAKALTNWKRFTKDGEQEVKEIKRDEDGTIKENLIIKGNNLLALHSLKKQFAGKVKLIYIDPPYYFKDTKADDAFVYNSNFKLSTWLTFMKNRLDVAKDLLADDGTIFIQIEDDGQAYLQLLLNDIFKNNYLNTVIVKAKASSGASGGGEDKKLKKNTEYIHIYCKNSFISFNDIYTEERLDKYIEDLKVEEKSFAYKSVLLNSGKCEYITSTQDGRGKEIKIYKHKNYEIKSVSQISKEEKIEEYEVYKKYIDFIFTTENAQTSIRTRVLDATGNDDCLYTAEYVPVSGKNKGRLTKVMFIGNTKRLVSFLKNTCEIKKNEIFKQLKIGTLWDDMSWSSVFSEGNVRLKSGKKPEKLLQRILEMATEKNDIVLDYHLGSGTTCAVAHKIGRQYIGIEQLDYGKNDSVVRLQNVINGEQSGISKSANWQDGGDFIYFELAKWNEAAKEKIQASESLDELIKFFDEMYERYFLNYNLKIKEFREKVIHEEAFKNLSLDEQKKMFVAMLDNNQMYVNKTEMADTKFGIDKEDQKLTSQFYNSEK
jgi:adenine-specific DNA-methyltransferase